MSSAPGMNPMNDSPCSPSAYGVAQGTAEKAVRVLRDEGIVRTVRGKGIYTLPRG
jgi:DNA-binding IscR family transcriptional regulator